MQWLLYKLFAFLMINIHELVTEINLSDIATAIQFDTRLK